MDSYSPLTNRELTTLIAPCLTWDASYNINYPKGPPFPY